MRKSITALVIAVTVTIGSVSSMETVQVAFAQDNSGQVSKTSRTDPEYMNYFSPKSDYTNYFTELGKASAVTGCVEDKKTEDVAFADLSKQDKIDRLNGSIASTLTRYVKHNGWVFGKPADTEGVKIDGVNYRCDCSGFVAAVLNSVGVLSDGSMYLSRDFLPDGKANKEMVAAGFKCSKFNAGKVKIQL